MAVTEDNFDKRYYQKYPKWKEKRKRQEDQEKKSFQKQCRMLYYGRRMHLAKALDDLRRDNEEKELQGFFDRDRIMNGEVPFPPGISEVIDKGKMSNLLELYRDKLFPFHQLEDFMPPNDITDEDIIKLMETTGRIKQGEKVYEPFAEYLKQRAIYEQKYGEWKTKKSAAQRHAIAQKRRQQEALRRQMQDEVEDVEEGGSNYDLKREIGGEQVDGRSSLMMEGGLENQDEADEMAILERKSMHLRDYKPTKQIRKG